MANFLMSLFGKAGFRNPDDAYEMRGRAIVFGALDAIPDELSVIAGVLNINNTPLTFANAVGFGFYNVKDYGAVGDGAHDDTAGIQAALDAAAGTPTKQVFFPAGIYKTGPLSVNDNGVHISGAGVYATVITFVPTGNKLAPTASNNVGDPGTCFDFNKTAGAAILYNCSLSGMRITTTNTSFTKAAVRTCECSQLVLSDLLIDNFYGGDSVGIHTYGHELMNVQRVYSAACVPIRISRSPITYSGVAYSGDHFRFADCYLRGPHTTDGATLKPATLKSCCVLVDDAVFMSNLGFEGQQAWVGGQYGLYWVNPGNSNSIIYDLYFKNVRHEQADTGDGTGIWMFKIDFTGAANIPRNILWENCYGAGTTTEGGWYLRRIQQTTFIDNHMPCNSGAGSLPQVMDVGDCYQIDWLGMYTDATSRITIGANVGSLRNGVFRQGYTLPISGHWMFESNPRVAKVMAAGAANNWAANADIGGTDFPTGVKSIVLDTTAGAASLGGLPPPTATYMHGDRIRLTNKNGGNNLTVKHNDGLENTASHRFECAGAADVVIGAGATKMLEYDTTLSRWVLI